MPKTLQTPYVFLVGRHGPVWPVMMPKKYWGPSDNGSQTI